MDHGVVKRLRGDVGDRLAEQRRRAAAAGVQPMSGEDERQFARAIIAQVLEEHARSEITVGRPPPNAQEEEELAAAIHAALFGRPSDTAKPLLARRLPDGSRLSALRDVTLRPAVSIRRARMGKVFLADLVGNGTLTPDLASFLA